LILFEVLFDLSLNQLKFLDIILGHNTRKSCWVRVRVDA